MPRIKQLPPEEAQKIAAGEVIEQLADINSTKENHEKNLTFTSRMHINLIDGNGNGKRRRENYHPCIQKSQIN